MIAESLIALGFEPGVDFNCRDDSDGRGPYIAEWLTDRPQPTLEEMESATRPQPLDMIAYAAQQRWEKEVGGTDVGGMVIHTDDRSKSLIMGARLAAEADPDFTTDWKAADGSFVTIDATTIVAVSNAVLAHVASCFAIEAQVIDAIGNGAITTIEEIDSAFDNL